MEWETAEPVLKALDRWPLVRQLLGTDRLGRGAAVKSRRSEQLRARTAEADEVIKSVCPYCAVGCAQNVYVQDGKVTQIEGDPDAPHSRGRLCPKGAATLQLTTGDAREHGVLYRRPGGSDWEELDLETAMDMVAERVLEARAESFEWDADGHRAAGPGAGEPRRGHAGQRGEQRPGSRAAALSTLAAALVGISAHLGGELAYKHGIRAERAMPLR